jgi:hypothetical protein
MKAKHSDLLDSVKWAVETLDALPKSVSEHANITIDSTYWRVEVNIHSLDGFVHVQQLGGTVKRIGEPNVGDPLMYCEYASATGIVWIGYARLSEVMAEPKAAA